LDWSDLARRLLEQLGEGQLVEVPETNEAMEAAVAALRDQGLVEVEPIVNAAGGISRMVRLTERGQEALSRRS
jgi:hypothetical protein